MRARQSSEALTRLDSLGIDGIESLRHQMGHVRHDLLQLKSLVRCGNNVHPADGTNWCASRDSADALTHNLHSALDACVRCLRDEPVYLTPWEVQVLLNIEYGCY